MRSYKGDDLLPEIAPKPDKVDESVDPELARREKTRQAKIKQQTARRSAIGAGVLEDEEDRAKRLSGRAVALGTRSPGVLG